MDMWVELPAAPEPSAKPPRARRARGKAKPAVEAIQPADEIADSPVETEFSAPPTVAAPVAPVPVEAPLVSAPVEPTPLQTPEPAIAAAPDMAEILSPPEKPKRGWWRRNG